MLAVGREAPGTRWSPESPLGRRLDRFDDAVDAALERFRGRRPADTAAVILSNLSDYGYVWVALALWKGRRPGLGRRRAIAALGVSGVVSYAVNAGIKALVRRERPAAVHQVGDRQAVPVRRPSSSSFPSGHTLAAFSTAVLLPDGPEEMAVCLTFAGAVAASRLHLRAHHASDVVAGAIVGSALGALGRPIAEWAAGRRR